MTGSGRVSVAANASAACFDTTHVRLDILTIRGFLCVALAVLKLTSEVHWSWWRVLLPLWLVLGHNILYVTVGLVWIYLAEYGTKGEEATIRQDHDPYGYQLGAMLCFLICLDNLLKQIEGPRDTVWFWLLPVS